MKNPRKLGSKVIVFLMLCSLALSSCQKSMPTPPSSTPEPATATASSTIAPSNTPTVNQTPTLTPTQTITSTPSPSPTPEMLSYDKSFSLTPLPSMLIVIQGNNINNVRELATWGTGKVNDLAVSPDSQIIAIATNLGVFLYDSVYFERLAVVETANAVQAITFSPNNQWIALAQFPDQILILSRENFIQIAQMTIADSSLAGQFQREITFTPESARLSSVTFAPDALYIDRWETTSWQSLDAFKTPSGSAAYINPNLSTAGFLINDDLAFQSLIQSGESQSIPLPALEPKSFWQDIRSDGGEILPSSDGFFILINSGKSIAYWHLLHESFTYLLEDFPLDIPDPCLDVSPTCLNRDNSISWDCSVEEDQRKPILTAEMSPNNLVLILSLGSGGTECRQVSDGSLLWEIDATYTKVEFTPNSDYFFGVLADGTIEKRLIRDGALANMLKEHPNQLFDIDFSPDGSILAAAYSDGWIRVYSTSNGQMLGVLNGNAASLAFSSTGQQLAAGLMDGIIRIFELDQGRYYDVGTGHLDAVSDLDFSPDDQQLLTGSRDCTAGLWGLPDGYRILNIKPDRRNPFQISNIALGIKDSLQYYSGSVKNGIFVFEGTDNKQILLDFQKGFTDIALSANGELLGAAGIRTWLLPASSTSKPIDALLLTSQRPSDGLALAFSPDNSTLVAATRQDLLFWGLPEGEEITYLQRYPWPPPDGEPVSLNFSLDGRLIGMGSQDGLIHIFGIPESP